MKPCFNFKACKTLIPTGEREIRAPLICKVCRTNPAVMRLARIATEAITGMPMPVSAPKRNWPLVDKLKEEDGGGTLEWAAFVVVGTILVVLIAMGVISVVIWAIS